MKVDTQHLQLVQVAKLYYLENLTQSEVAQRMGISRPQVSKLLALAREQGIVSITVNDNMLEEDDTELLAALCQKYKLKGGLVVADTADMHQALRQCAVYLALEIQLEYNLGIGWGPPLGELVSLFAKQSFKPTPGTVCSLIGQAPLPTHNYHIKEMVHALAQSLGRKAYALEAKAFAESREDKEAVESAQEQQAVINKWQELDAALLTVQNYPSSPDEATGMRFGESLRRQQAVGSFLSYFYNVHGDIISGDNDFTCRASLANLRHCHYVYGIGVGAQSNSVEGALKTGIFTHMLLTRQQVLSVL